MHCVLPRTSESVGLEDSTHPTAHGLSSGSRLLAEEGSVHNGTRPHVSDVSPSERFRMRVLVVEDERELLRVVAQALREDGYAVDEANEGQSGLAKAQSW